MDHLQQEVNTRLLVTQDSYVAQYMTPKQVVLLTPERIVQLYEVFQDDMPGERSVLTIKRSGSLEGKMENDECR